jgi:hypothetical protein
MLKNYKELKVWQKSYQLCLEIYKTTKTFPKRKSLIKSLENKHLNPRILDPFLPTNWEKNLLFKLLCLESKVADIGLHHVN